MLLKSANKATLLCLLLLAGLSCFGQKGFLGKRHTITTDPFRLLHQHELMLEYMYTPKTHRSLVVGFSRQSMVVPELAPILGIQVRLVPPAASNGEGHLTSTWFSLAYVSNSDELNMPMPLGYYLGYELAMRRSRVTDLEDTELYRSRQFYISYLFGRNILISKQLFVGFRIPVGFTFGRVKIEDHFSNTFNGTKYPSDIPIFHLASRWGRDYDNTQTILGAYIYPSIKLGFMF
jgi:hypothetical protein